MSAVTDKESSCGEEESVKKSAERAAAVAARLDRDRQVMELARRGLTYEAIGQAVSLSETQAWRVVQRELTRAAARLDEATDAVRRLEACRLDELQASISPSALSGDMRAIDRVLRIMERRARLLGLDMPSQSEVSVAPFVVRIDAAQLPPPMQDVIGDV